LVKLTLIASAGLLLSSAGAFAQSAEAPGAAAPAPDGATSAPAEAAPAQPTEFTDQQIDSFGQAIVKIQDVSADATLDETQKQERMVAIVQEEGLDPQTFNAIGSAAQSDPELQQRVQLALANAQGGATQNQ
jgi:hypothetical protein